MFDFTAKEAERLQKSYDIKLSDGVLTVVQYTNNDRVPASIADRNFFSSNPKSGEMRLSAEVFSDAMLFLCCIDIIKFKKLHVELCNNPTLASYYDIAEHARLAVVASLCNF